LNNLRIFKEYYRNFFNHFVITEQDKKGSLIPHLQNDERTKYVFALNAGEFNRSWGLNIGAVQYLDNPKIKKFLFCDVDVILNPQAIYGSQAEIVNTGFVNPYSYIKHLTPRMTETFEKGNFGFDMDLSGGITTPSFAGGALLMNKDIFKDINGWDEIYRGWGGEDNALAYLLLRKYKQLKSVEKGVAVHLFHNSDFPNQVKKQHSYYKSNLDRARWITEIGVDKYLRIKRKEKIGNVKRYL
jgi:hypothetical protein